MFYVKVWVLCCMVCVSLNCWRYASVGVVYVLFWLMYLVMLRLMYLFIC